MTNKLFSLLKKCGVANENTTCKDFVLNKYSTAYIYQDKNLLYKILYKKKVYDEKQQKVITITKELMKSFADTEDGAWEEACKRILRIEN